jgi:hypothetical protein
MSEIVFVFPTASTPGWLRRQRRAVALQNELLEKPSPDAVDRLVEFLLEYVSQPEDRNEAREAIWDMPQDELTKAITTLGESATPPKASAPPVTG